MIQPREISCPVCRAKNSTPPTCRRCKADLSVLFALESQRDTCLRAARTAIVDGDSSSARLALDEADRLRHDSDIDEMNCLLCLLSGDYSGAWEAHRKALTRS